METNAIYINLKGNHISIKYNMINLIHSTQHRTDRLHRMDGFTPKVVEEQMLSIKY